MTDTTNTTTVKCTNCKSTLTTDDVFSKFGVDNAWQKGGYNYYETTCKCGNVVVFKVLVQDV